MSEERKHSSTYERRTPFYPNPYNKALLEGYNKLTAQPKNSIINDALKKYFEDKPKEIINQIRKESKSSD